MLKTLKAFLEATPYYLESELKDIPDTCCSGVRMKVICFDQVKNDFCEKIGVPEHCRPKSVDLLYFNKKNSSLCFIEMKRYNKLNKLGLTDFVEKEVDDLPHKIVESVLLLLSIMGCCSTEKNQTALFKDFLHPKCYKLSPYLLVNIDDKDLVPLTLSLLPKLKLSITKKMYNNIAIINCKNLENNFK